MATCTASSKSVVEPRIVGSGPVVGGLPVAPPLGGSIDSIVGTPAACAEEAHARQASIRQLNTTMLPRVHARMPNRFTTAISALAPIAVSTRLRCRRRARDHLDLASLAHPTKPDRIPQSGES